MRRGRPQRDGRAAGSVFYVLDAVEQIDRILAAAEARRSAKLKEIDHHRSVLARHLRAREADIIDAEFEDLHSVEVEAPPQARDGAGHASRP